MRQSHPASSTSRVVVVAAALAVLLGLLWSSLNGTGLRLVAEESPAAQPAAATDPPPVSAPIRAVQANIKSGMGKKKFKAEVAAIYAQAPDFVTFNEVTFRPDSWLVPPGYAMWRTPGAYTGETPVVWNTRRWNLVDRGTFQVGNKLRKAKKTKKFQLGVRYANWVALQSNTGERISVVSTHFAPRSGYTVDQIEPSFQRLSVLVDQLRAHGPVLVGGDLNVNYRDVATYPRALVTALGLTPVYDVTGVPLPTGMYRNATIDYFLLASATQFGVNGQTVRTGYSDHRQLIADLVLTGSSASAFTPGTVVSDPTRPRAVTSLMVKSLNLAPKGAVVHLVSRSLKMKAVERAIKKARKRGVEVQVLTASSRPNSTERRLAKLLGTKTRKKSWIAHQPNWAAYGLPTASSLVSASGGTRALRIDSNRPLVRDAHRVSTRAVITADKATYDQLFVKFFAAVGRKV